MINEAIHPSMAAELREMATILDDPGGTKSIDWPRLREVLAGFLQTYGPILFPLILNLLTGIPPKQPVE